MRLNSGDSHQSKLVRHDHDIHAGYTSSIAPGMIIPQYWHILTPGDSVYFSSHLRARFNDIVTAFLGEVDVHLDYFFVPLQMLYTPFGQIFAGTDDYISSLFDSFAGKRGPLTVPLLQADSFYGTQQQTEDNDTDAPWDGAECFAKGSARLLDALDANPFVVIGNDASQSRGDGQRSQDAVDYRYCLQKPIFPWAFAAYQAIYQKCYRNEDIERLDVHSYNFDYAYTGTQVTSFRNTAMAQLRYCSRVSDYFTRFRLSPISTIINTVGNQSFISDASPYNLKGGEGVDTPAANLFREINDFIGPASDSLNQSAGGSIGDIPGYAKDFGGSSLSSVSDNSDLNYLNAQNIRAVFALDKFARIYGRAEKTYDAQILAHFGIKIPHDVKHDLTRIKTYHFSIQSDPVYATADTPNGSSLGQLGGQASGVLDTPREKFTAPVHGVFMAVAYVQTRPRYECTFSKLHFCGNRVDFPIAEFDKLGAQPVYQYEVNPWGFLDNDNFATRVAWQNRYQQFKQKYNRASMYFLAENLTHYGQNTNPYSPWVLSRSVVPMDKSATTVMPLSTYFESPHALDSVMSVQFDSRWSSTFYVQPHLMWQSDPIVMEFMCDAKLVSWMSPTGEPDL